MELFHRLHGKCGFGGKGSAEQRIVNTEHVSGFKSLRLWGADGWGAVAAKPITLTTDAISYEVMVKAENWGLQYEIKTGVILGFAYKISGSLWTYWASVTFHSNGYIRAYGGGQTLQSYNLDTWYKIKTIFTISTRTYSVWINDEYKGTFLDTNTRDPSQIEAIALASDHAEQVCYFDDVKVFTGGAHIVLMPSTGFAATTVVGSGFSTNSKITIVWDGTVIPTVPSPLTIDANGTFTAIISVLTQNSPGPHTVNATDESGNWATATFNVVDMTGPPGVTSTELQFLVNGLTMAVSFIALCLAAIALFRKKP